MGWAPSQPGTSEATRLDTARDIQGHTVHSQQHPSTMLRQRLAKARAQSKPILDVETLRHLIRALYGLLSGGGGPGGSSLRGLPRPSRASIVPGLPAGTVARPPTDLPALPRGHPLAAASFGRCHSGPFRATQGGAMICGGRRLPRSPQTGPGATSKPLGADRAQNR